MAKQLFQFGDRETTDIKLQLISEDVDEENLVYFHSHVLKKSEFYEAWISHGINMISSVSEEIYLKCFQLMYSCEADVRFCFSGVDEALDILTVASQMRFNEGIEQCMQYLDAVRWSPEQEAKLRAMLSSLQINILPDLAARIGMSPDKLDRGNLDMLKVTLHDMLSPISFGSSNSLRRNEVEKYIIGYFEAAKMSSDKAVTDALRSALLEEFRSIVEHIRINEKSYTEEIDLNAWPTLLWLFYVIKRCDEKLYQMFIKNFCEDAYLPYSLLLSGEHVVDLKADIVVDRILNAMGNGEIIMPASFRAFFLTNWLYPMVRPIKIYRSDKLPALERGIMNVADTLPLAVQRTIYTIWRDSFQTLSMDCSNALKWWAQKVHDAIKNGKII